MRHGGEKRDLSVKEILTEGHSRRRTVPQFLCCSASSGCGGRSRDVEVYVAENNRLGGASGVTAERWTGWVDGKRDAWRYEKGLDWNENRKPVHG